VTDGGQRGGGPTDDTQSGGPASDAATPGDPATQVDAVTLEVLRNALAAVAEEMTASLVRTAHSPNITERRDCSCAVFDAAGELVAQSETIPVHLGAMPFSVDAALDAFPPAELAPGDAILLNDPFAGGAHLPDLTLVSPVFPGPPDDLGGVEPKGDDARQPIAYVANRAHHADVGGATAGSVSADATKIDDEGVRISPVKLRSGGALNDTVRDRLLANTRTPDERRGDLRAQESANTTGRRRVRELAADRGIAGFAAGCDAIQTYSERRMRAALRELPDGTWSFADALDDDGHGTRDVRIAASVKIDGDAVRVDFADSAPMTTGPLNAPFAVTASATYYALRCATDPDVPPNAGCYRPIAIDTPSPSVVDAAPPAAVVGGNLETSQRIVDVLFGALAKAVPDRIPAAGQGTMNNLTVGGTDPRDDTPFAFYETQAGGYGARPDRDGMDGVHVHMSNTLNTPIEALETAYPVRVERYALRPDSGGAGEYRGGCGLRRDITLLAPATVSVLADRHRTRPYGLAGGDPGATGGAVLFREATAGGAPDDPPDDAGERLPSKGTVDAETGTTLSLRTPGAGGWGDPGDRDLAAIQRDCRRGLVTVAAVRKAYGVDPDRLEDGRAP
jgi:N-methylhydantoinase B